MPGKFVAWDSLSSFLRSMNILSQIGSDKEILAAYMLRKPMTFVEIYDEPSTKIERFIDEMRRFFFVYVNRIDHRNAHVYVSRLKSIIDYIGSVGGLDDDRADIFGILCGYSTEMVYDYCKIGNESLTK